MDSTLDSVGGRIPNVAPITRDGWDPTNPSTSQGYRITDIGITYSGNVTDDKKNVSIKTKSDSRKWTLKDKNKDQESGDFEVTVSYTGPDGTCTGDIHCDPGWINK